MNERDIERIKNRIQLIKEAVVQVNGTDTVNASPWLLGYLKGITEVEQIINEETEKWFDQ